MSGPGFGQVTALVQQTWNGRVYPVGAILDDGWMPDAVVALAVAQGIAAVNQASDGS